MPSTPVPSGSSSALKLLVLSVASSCAFGLAYEHAAAYYVELSRTHALLVWTKFPMPLLALVPGVVWSACRAVAFVALGVYVAYTIVLGSIAASYDRLMQGNHFDIDRYFEKATGKRPSTQDKAKCAFLHRMNVGDAPISTTPMALAETPSPSVKGLRVTSRKDGPTPSPGAAPSPNPNPPPDPDPDPDPNHHKARGRHVASQSAGERRAPISRVGLCRIGACTNAVYRRSRDAAPRGSPLACGVWCTLIRVRL